MSTSIISQNIAGNVKPTFASSSATGLTVRANGEEHLGVLDAAGNLVDAQIPAPTVAPILSTGSPSRSGSDGSTQAGTTTTGVDGVTTASSPETIANCILYKAQNVSNLIVNGVSYPPNKCVGSDGTSGRLFTSSDIGKPISSTHLPALANFKIIDVGGNIAVLNSNYTNGFKANVRETITLGASVSNIYHSTGHNFAPNDVGSVFSGDDIPANTTVTGWQAPGDIILSNAPTATGTSLHWQLGTSGVSSLYTAPSGNFSSADLNKGFSGDFIQSGTSIQSIVSPTQITLNKPPTSVGTGLNWTITGGGGGQGSLPANQYAAYAFVYAATSRYPFVENDVTIGGSPAPRGNPSPEKSIQIPSNGSAINVQCIQIARLDIDQIWVFRTAFFTSQSEADTEAQAGNMFFLGSIPNLPALAGQNVNYVDNNPTSAGDQIEEDNFGVPVFQFVIYQDPYWWGWGNYPFISSASWDINGVITLTDPTKKWFNGRNGQFVRLSNISVGGADGLGTFFFKWLTATTAQLTSDGTASTNAGGAGSGTIVVQGPSTTLYRSKPRNPFSWGFTEFLPDNSRVPQVFVLKIGGGQGTAIGIIPVVNYLLLSTEYPTASYVLDLALAGETNFGSSRKLISDFYSISSHFSQFAATKNFTLIRELPDERIVLWGWDAKNFAILECDGFKINPISQRISKTLRQMSQDRSRQLLAHGAYDARNKFNCMWLPTQNSGMLVNFLVAQHGPTGEWYFHDEHDVLCSASFQDGETNLNKIYVGTQSGLIGEAFTEGYFSEWQLGPNNTGTVDSSDGSSITRNDGGIFNANSIGYVGAWCLVTDQNGDNEQWARISGVTQTTLTFDFIYSKIGGQTTGFNPIPIQGWLFYVGLIECRALKYFDLSQPTLDKKLTEIWFTLDGVDQVPVVAGQTASTFLRYYRDLSRTPYAPTVDANNNPLAFIAMHQNLYEDGSPSQQWFTLTPPTEKAKLFGIEIIDRGSKQWRMFDLSLKPSP